MALSPTGTLSVETLDRSDPDPLDEGPWQATCEIREPFLRLPASCTCSVIWGQHRLGSGGHCGRREHGGVGGTHSHGWTWAPPPHLRSLALPFVERSPPTWHCGRGPGRGGTCHREHTEPPGETGTQHRLSWPWMLGQEGQGSPYEVGGAQAGWSGAFPVLGARVPRQRLTGHCLPLFIPILSPGGVSVWLSQSWSRTKSTARMSSWWAPASCQHRPPPGPAEVRAHSSTGSIT